MYSQLDEEQLLFVETARKFAVDEIRPRVPGIEESDELPVDLYERMCELGFRDMSIPEEYGGLGASMVTHLAVAEEIARENLSLGLLGTANMVASLIAAIGTEEQKARILSTYVGGTAMAGFGFTEPGAGSDAAGIRSTAVRDGDTWILNGQKTFISYRKVCDAFLVSARTDDHGGISAFFVEKNLPGVSVGAAFHKIGLHGSDCGELFFDGVRVPAENMIGPEGKGLRGVLRVLDEARLGTAIGAVGLAQRAMEIGIEYVRERTAFGKKVVENQGIQWYLAEMQTAIEAARSLVFDAARLYDAGQPFATAAAMAKLQATEMANTVCSQAVQLCGGLGLTNEYGVERYLRDAKTTTIIEGTSEILKIVIARSVVGR